MLDCIYNDSSAEARAKMFSFSPFAVMNQVAQCEANDYYVGGILAQEIKASNIPLEAKYLLKLVKASGIYFKDMQKILALKDKQGNKIGLKTLWLYCLLQKAAKKKLMSARYNGFLKKVQGLILAGKIKIKFYRLITGQANQTNYYNEKTNTIEIHSLRPEAFTYQRLLADLELSLVHELYHAFQDSEKEIFYHSQLEAEAGLASADYMLSAYPQYELKGWIQYLVYSELKTARQSFCIPNAVVRKLKNKPAKSKEVQAAVTREIALRYLNAEMFIMAFNHPQTRHYEQQFYQHVLSAGRDFSTEVQRAVDVYQKFYEKHGAQAHVQLEGTGATRTFRFTGFGMSFLSAVRAYTIQKWLNPKVTIGDKERAEVNQHINQIFDGFVKYTKLPGVGKGSPQEFLKKFDGVE